MIEKLSGFRKQADRGKMSGAAYDTAWAARVTDESGKPLFPECVQWLLENQKMDGSWGSDVVNYHDRILSTLSVIIALKELDERRYESQIQKGELYIWENIENLKTESCRFVGSELLIPSLMQQAEPINLNLPYHIKVYKSEYQAKLRKIDESLWYSPLTTLSFSLEFLGDSVDKKRFSKVQLPNGSVGNSPAATAFFLEYTKDVRAHRYLKNILQLTGDGSLIEAYPFEVFECGWVMYNLILAGLYFEQYTEICDFLGAHTKPMGIGMSADFPVPDLDDTTMLCRALHEMQYPIDFSMFDAYDMGDYYATYTFEVGPSVSTNIHVLDFIKRCPKFPHREDVMEKLVRFIRREICPPGYWTDKWHISPYYTTGHAIIALCDVDSSLAETAVSWILESQNENGIWGENSGTLEETALAVQALMYYNRHVEHIDMESMSGAISALNLDSFTLLSTNMPDMWICKVLYSPVRIVCSSIASAQFMVRTSSL